MYFLARSRPSIYIHYDNECGKYCYGSLILVFDVSSKRVVYNHLRAIINKYKLNNIYNNIEIEKISINKPITRNLVDILFYIFEIDDKNYNRLIDRSFRYKPCIRRVWKR